MLGFIHLFDKHGEGTIGELPFVLPILRDIHDGKFLRFGVLGHPKNMVYVSLEVLVDTGLD